MEAYKMPMHRVCVVGPSTRFLSGITYYTFSLCRALASRERLSTILMRQLLPTRLYPGNARVGAPITTLRLPHKVPRFDGLDWYWIPSMVSALRFLLRQRPQVVIFQWWTGTVLHSYLALALVARLLGATIVVEFHEVLDPSEDRLVLVHRYVRLLAPAFFRLAGAFVVHSEFDRSLVRERYGAMNAATTVTVIPHATYDHYHSSESTPLREAPVGVCNVLFFGLIRPYKGLDDLLRAFNALEPSEIDRYWLTIAGETWDGWTEPAELVAHSPYRDRITFINRYVSDEEVGAIFAGADVAVFPYHRSSQSGALHIAMHYGLPVIVTAVGGLVEAVTGYDGAVIMQSGEPGALPAALRTAAGLRGRRFAAPHDWDATASRYADLIDGLLAPQTSLPRIVESTT